MNAGTLEANKLQDLMEIRIPGELSEKTAGRLQLLVRRLRRSEYWRDNLSAYEHLVDGFGLRVGRDTYGRGLDVERPIRLDGKPHVLPELAYRMADSLANTRQSFPRMEEVRKAVGQELSEVRPISASCAEAGFASCVVALGLTPVNEARIKREAVKKEGGLRATATRVLEFFDPRISVGEKVKALIGRDIMYRVVQEQLVDRRIRETQADDIFALADVRFGKGNYGKKLIKDY